MQNKKKGQEEQLVITILTKHEFKTNTQIMIQSCAKEVCLYADFCSKGQLQIALDTDFTPHKITKEIT